MLKWIKVTRIWALTASLIPVLIGGALAWHQGYFDWPAYIATLIAGIGIQAAVNLNNTYDDFMNGVDERKTHYGPAGSPLVRGEIKPFDLRILSCTIFAIVIILGLWIVHHSGWLILAYGIVGVVGAYTYTGGPWPYKYHSLGIPFVFFLMGPLMVMPTYYIQSGLTTMEPFWVSLPIAFVVTAIMQANDIRDVEDDQNTGVRTPSALLGRTGALWLFAFLMVGGFVSLPLLVWAGIIDFPCLLPLILTPSLVSLWKTYSAPKISNDDLQILVRIAAKIHLIFGFLYFVGILISRH